eukprot:scaffold38029_cov33-Phaeocystis_antarctica.AAC.1
MRLAITPDGRRPTPPRMPPHWPGVLGMPAPGQRAAPSAAASDLAGSRGCEAVLRSSRKADTA